MTPTLAAVLQLHHQPVDRVVEVLDTVTHGLPVCEWPPVSAGLLWALHIHHTVPSLPDKENEHE